MGQARVAAGAVLLLHVLVRLGDLVRGSRRWHVNDVVRGGKVGFSSLIRKRRTGSKIKHQIIGRRREAAPG